MDGEGKVNGQGATEIVQATPATLAAFEETSDQLLARASQQIALHQGIIKLISANIPAKQIVLFGDNIWLTKDACLRILGWIGANVLPDNEIKEFRYESPDGPYIVFETWGTVELKNGRKVRAPGNSSTIDDFFAKENLYVCPTCGERTEFRDGKGYCAKCKQAVRGEKQEHYKPLSEVDIPSIRLKATTNFYNHALQVLGVMPTKEELLAAGMKFGDAGAKVDFKKKDSAKAPPAKQEASPKGAAANTPAAAPPPRQENNGVPRANIPGWNDKKKPYEPDPLPVGKGIISNVEEKTTKPGKKSKGGQPYLLVTQNGHYLYCFKNSEVETLEGKESTFWLIKEARNQFCDFVVETKDGIDGKPMHSIVGATRIGRHAWESGEPVMPEGSGSNEDIPY